MKIKICGITCSEDAFQAVEAGADLLGFNFYPKSPRCIDPAAAARIISALKNSRAPVQTVGVFVNAAPEAIRAIMEACGLDLAQLSGDEPPETLAALGCGAFKALRPRNSKEMARFRRIYPPAAGSPAYLLDASLPGQYGGTGRTADWSLARSLAKAHPILLAGGLTPENAAAAAAWVHPWGLDVASGVEASPRRKDPQRVAAFIAAVHQAAGSS